MNEALEFYTRTMARVYAQQGHWDKAVEIYRHLIKQQPDQSDLAEALAAAEKNLEAMRKKKLEDLVPLLRQWFDLMFKYNRLQKLRKLKDQLKIQ